MGKKSKRNRQPHASSSPYESYSNERYEEYRYERRERHDEREEHRWGWGNISIYYHLVTTVLLAFWTVFYEHVYPTNQSRKQRNQQKQSPPNSNFFPDQSLSPENVLDPYTLLGLSRGKCTLEEVKKSYRILALKYHPDRQTNTTDEDKILAEVKMKDINKAYEDIQLELAPLSPQEEEEEEEKEKEKEEERSSSQPEKQQNQQSKSSSKSSKHNKKATKSKKSRTGQGRGGYEEEDAEEDREKMFEDEMNKQRELYMKMRKVEIQTLKRESTSQRMAAENAKDKQGNKKKQTKADLKKKQHPPSSTPPPPPPSDHPDDSNLHQGDQQKEAASAVFKNCKHPFAIFIRLNLPVLFCEKLLSESDEKEEQEQQEQEDLLKCVLDDNGNTLLHYCVYYNIESIGNEVMERSGERWWELVLQTNHAQRNAIEEARWLGVVPAKDSGDKEATAFAARISSLTETAIEQQGELKIAKNRSLDFSFLFNFVITIGFVYATSQLFLFSTPAGDVPLSADHNTFYFGIGRFERLAVAVVLMYLPIVHESNQVAWWASIGVLLILKCLYTVLFTLSYWSCGVLSIGFGILFFCLPYSIVFALFLKILIILGVDMLCEMPVRLVFYFLKFIVIPIVGKPNDPSIVNTNTSEFSDFNSFIHGRCFRNNCIITSVWIFLGLFQAVLNYIYIPLLLFIYSYMYMANIALFILALVGLVLLLVIIVP